jgi:hypothetical protein
MLERSRAPRRSAMPVRHPRALLRDDLTPVESETSDG